MCALSGANSAKSSAPGSEPLSPEHSHLRLWVDGTLSTLSYAPVGALIASRHPANPVGWLLCLYGLVISLSNFTAQYATYALLAQPGSLPGGEVMAWITSWILPIINGLTVFYILLFPTGRLPGRRWRWLGWLTVAFIVVGVILAAFSPGALLGMLGPIRNPLGVEGFTGVYRAVLFTMAPLLTVAAALAVFMRLRRAVGVERQQIKWFTYAAAATVIATILAYIVPGVIGTPAWFERAGFALNIATILAIPVAIGIAILRYHLYDIDLLVNRTLVYVSLTANRYPPRALLRGHRSVAEGLRLAHRREVNPRCGGIHPLDSSCVPASEAPRAVVYRQALLPQEVRCEKDLGGFLSQAEGRDGSASVERRPGGGGKGDDAARTRLSVAASRYRRASRRRARLTDKAKPLSGWMHGRREPGSGVTGSRI
jgi:uncharacterized membrane protein YhdT